LLIPPDFAAPTGITWWLGDWMVATTAAVGSTIESWLPPSMESLLATQETTAEVQADLEAIAPAAVEVARHSLTWTSTLFLLWAGIVIARCSLLAYAWLQVRRWLHTAEIIIEPATLALLQRACARVGWQRPIALATSRACITPLVTGWFKPVILLPSNVRAALQADELEAVLVHELAHVVRHDGWFRLLQAVLSAVYFYHPALWLANWQLHRTCEDACDEQTIAALSGQRRSYAEAIFKAAAVVGYEPPYLALAMLDNGYPVKRRLQRILDPGLPLAAGSSLGRWSFAGLVAIVLLPSGLPVSLATPPESVRLSEVGGNAREIVPREAPVGEEQQELQALAKLDSPEFDARMAAYATLQRVGTVRALGRLETAFLERTGIEQDAAKRALDAVWQQLLDDSAQRSSSTSRFFQAPLEN
jgi:beta-lactamase regulating signal transducer with metallopeptidase domain